MTMTTLRELTYAETAAVSGGSYENPWGDGPDGPDGNPRRDFFSELMRRVLLGGDGGDGGDEIVVTAPHYSGGGGASGSFVPGDSLGPNNLDRFLDHRFSSVFDCQLTALLNNGPHLGYDQSVFDWQPGDIVVTAPYSSREIGIAHAITDRYVNERVATFAYFAGTQGLEIGAALRAAGMSADMAAGFIGVGVAGGATTDVVSLLPRLREVWSQALFPYIAADVHAHPETYGSWMMNPITGEVFDGNSAPYNPDD
ncbi:hypothetical protein [Sphingomonas sp. SUN039]|uniref:hypothetical protein n=1 Tax=Sphingomonas sp. SUN039 TaxID=2937787 RepID=UPI0021647DE7|nr:hypothetical protein [Sphingomonas sp. SUN039]UVO54509.1 hypothetical protein M0209_10400 [Sphingomonas sp. SUN039]